MSLPSMPDWPVTADAAGGIGVAGMGPGPAGWQDIHQREVRLLSEEPDRGARPDRLGQQIADASAVQVAGLRRKKCPPPPFQLFKPNRASLDQKSAMFDTLGKIDVEHVNRRTTDGGAADKLRADPGEVRVPAVLARIEQPRELASDRGNPGDVRSLVEVVVVAREREVLSRSRAMMLDGNDMVELEGQDVEALR